LILPNYLHIGYSKAASTWLQNLFRKEEEVFFVYKTDFFFPLDSCKYKNGLKYYADFFKGAEKYRIRIESNEHLLLPFHHPRFKCASTNLKVVETISKRIKENLPHIKILVIIRNQTDMLLSRYTQYILQGGKASANEFLTELVFSTENYKKYMDYRYGEVLKLLYDVFGKSHVLVLCQEELKKNPETFFDSLSNFFNRPFILSQKDTNKRRNPAPSAFTIRLLRFINRILVKEVETIYSRTKTRIPWIGWYIIVKVIRVLDRILIRKKNKKALFFPEHIKRIRSVFSEDNKALSLMLDKPIQDYGYFYS